MKGANSSLRFDESRNDCRRSFRYATVYATHRASGGRMTRKAFGGLWASLVGLLSLVASSLALVTVVAPQAQAYGTIPGREHSNITRAALGCPQSGTDNDYCFDPASLTVLAGGGGPIQNADFFGAVGWPDNLLKPGGADGDEAHCDNADYLDPSYNAGRVYPQTRAQASAALLNCVRHTREAFTSAVDHAADLLDTDNHLKTGTAFTQAKRTVLYDWGRLLHAVQDFYSHSNWADIPAPGLPVGLDNPPGLNMTTPSLLFNALAPEPTAAAIPRDLTTGCYSTSGSCRGHVRHGAPFNGDDTGLNKDAGKIDPKTGAATEPSKYRGKIGRNFQQSVTAAVTDTRLQWVDLRQGLEDRYTGPGQAWLMACGLLRDSPQTACTAGAAKAAGTSLPSADTKSSAGGAKAAACGVNWQQPGGANSTVFMQYVNCGSTALSVAPYAVGEGNESRYTLARVCRTVQPGQVTRWVIDPAYFPPEPTTLQAISQCWPPAAGTASRTQSVPPTADNHRPDTSPAAKNAARLRMNAPVHRVRRDADTASCGTTWAQPGGSGTTVTIDYTNCLGVPTLIAPLAIGDSPDARYSYTGLTQYVPAGDSATQFHIDPPLFPPVPTNLQWTTRVM
ncbi:hypothetical protein ACIP2Y_44580 [Streptomyces sviceus]|uniref:hypothetical protein n=1 Tax=Streptomyces sviceus TaxID=285530 RepID=UPI00382807BE